MWASGDSPAGTKICFFGGGVADSGWVGLTVAVPGTERTILVGSVVASFSGEFGGVVAGVRGVSRSMRSSESERSFILFVFRAGAEAEAEMDFSGPGSLLDLLKTLGSESTLPPSEAVPSDPSLLLALAAPPIWPGHQGGISARRNGFVLPNLTF